MTVARPVSAQGVVRKEADEKVAELARELDAARKVFAAKVKQFGEMADELNKRTGDATKGEKKRAAAELALLSVVFPMARFRIQTRAWGEQSAIADERRRSTWSQLHSGA